MTNEMSPQNMVEAALASSDRVRRAAEAVFSAARDCSAAANHVIVHRQLIGELRDAVREHYAAAPASHYHQNCATCTCREPVEIRDPYRPKNTADI